MYSCPHCFTFEPYLSEWIRTKPSYVDVIFLPAWWTETAKLHARAYYAAETLGVIEKMHEDFFHAIYVEKRDLSTQSGLRDFFGSYGIEPAKFDAALASPEVAKRSQRADALIKGYGVMGTPTVVVNGKYLTTLPWADRSFETWFKIVDELVAREHAALSASAVAK
jgi:thiol:disulfide interchange protein DsbA